MTATVAEPAPPVAPPRRRPTWPRWRPALRLAVRDARRNWRRSALVVALVALPVAAVVGAALYGTSHAAGALKAPLQALGSVADGSVERNPASPERADWTSVLPTDWRLVPWPDIGAELGAGSGVWASGTTGDFSDPVLAGLVTLSEGRLPAAADEVVLSSRAARTLGLEVGQTWVAPLDSAWVGIPRAPAELVVVGVGELAGAQGGSSFAAGVRPAGEQWRYLIDSPAPIAPAEAEAVPAGDVTLVARGRPLPERYGVDTSLVLSRELVVALSVAFLQIVMLAGAAFAVSTRRRQRELALLSAAGAEPGDLTRAMLASGLLLGGVGAALGFLLAWLVVVLGRPLLERWVSGPGEPLATVPPMELAIVLVPAVGLLAALGASVIPAVLASRIPLAQALRARDSVHVGAAERGPGVDRVATRAALAGGLLIAAGVLGFARIAASGGEPGDLVGGFGWMAGGLGLAVVATEIGIALLAPMVLALIAGRLPRLPVAARLAARDAARNRLRTSLAIAAIAVSVGVVAAFLTGLGSVSAAMSAAYRPVAAPGAVVFTGALGESGRAQVTIESVQAVRTALPGAAVALVGSGPTHALRRPASLALTSWCDPVRDLGVPAEAVEIMEPSTRAELAAEQKSGSSCLAPVPAGSPLQPAAVLGEPGSWRPGVVVVEPDDAALVLGFDDPDVRAQLESGGAVALSGSVVVDGRVRIATDPYLDPDADGAGAWLDGPVADIPALTASSPYLPAAVVVSPQTLRAAGLAAPMEAILAIPPPGAPPSARALASVPALEAAYVERGPIDTAALGGVGPDQRPLAGRSWGSVLLPLAFALLATILVTGLALGDARPELATMVAVGASPGVRRRFAMWSAAFIALVGGALGALAGIGPAWAMLQTVDPVPDPARCLWLPERSGMGTLSGLGATFCDTPYPIALDVPWLWLAGAVVAVAAVSSVVFGLFTRARVVLPAR